jgi:hypothetical protein
MKLTFAYAKGIDLLSLEKEDRAVAEIEVDEVFGLMGDKGPEVAPNNAMPGWAFPFVELNPC